jgi:hypothetical protein
MENDIIDDFQSGITQNQTDSKQRGLVKTFGWISFGIAIFYLLSGLFSLASSSMMNSISRVSSSLSGNELGYFERIGSLQMMSAALTLLVSVIFIIGAIGYVNFKEWGRKVYIGACLGGLLTNFLGVYVAFIPCPSFLTLREHQE